MPSRSIAFEKKFWAHYFEGIEYCCRQNLPRPRFLRPSIPLVEQMKHPPLFESEASPTFEEIKIDKKLLRKRIFYTSSDKLVSRTLKTPSQFPKVNFFHLTWLAKINSGCFGVAKFSSKTKNPSRAGTFWGDSIEFIFKVLKQS